MDVSTSNQLPRIGTLCLPKNHRNICALEKEDSISFLHGTMRQSDVAGSQPHHLRFKT